MKIEILVKSRHVIKIRCMFKWCVYAACVWYVHTTAGALVRSQEGNGVPWSWSHRQCPDLGAGSSGESNRAT